MPLARYFLAVGSLLIALLFILDAWLPKSHDAEKATADLPTIHIHSDLKWPERVVLDTGVPTIPAVQASGSESVAQTTSAPQIDEPAKARQENAFAKMQSSGPDRPESFGPTKREPTLQRKHRNRKTIAVRSHVPLAVRQARSGFDWFGNNPW